MEATAAAIPARARGMPDTAVLVIGAFTMPKPSPNSTYAVMSRQIGMSAVSPVRIRPLSAMVTPATTSGTRGPALATIRPDRGAQTAVSPAMGSV